VVYRLEIKEVTRSIPPIRRGRRRKPCSARFSTGTIKPATPEGFGSYVRHRAGVAEANPCQMVKRPGVEKPRDRVLSEDEIKRVWAALDREHDIVAALFRLRLLTARRGGEVQGAAWSEVDLVSGWWTIPAERSKNGLAHRVPLSPPSGSDSEGPQGRGEEGRDLGVSQHAEDRSPHQPRAEGNRAGGGPFRRRVPRSRPAANRREPHGRRRVPRLVVQKILNHVESGLTAVYDRHSYDPEKRAALDYWGARLEQIVTAERGANVVAFAARG
jgi:integrase